MTFWQIVGLIPTITMGIMVVCGTYCAITQGPYKPSTRFLCGAGGHDT